MAAILVFAITLAASVKTASYGVWELKRENVAGGNFLLILAAVCVALAGRYLVKYWA